MAAQRERDYSQGVTERALTRRGLTLAPLMATAHIDREVIDLA